MNRFECKQKIFHNAACDINASSFVKHGPCSCCGQLVQGYWCYGAVCIFHAIQTVFECAGSSLKCCCVVIFFVSCHFCGLIQFFYKHYTLDNVAVLFMSHFTDCCQGICAILFYAHLMEFRQYCTGSSTSSSHVVVFTVSN